MTTITAATPRKGARKASDIPEDILLLLNKGEIETANLTEWLVINHVKLVQHQFPLLGLDAMTKVVIDKLYSLKKPSTMNFIKCIGESLKDYCISNETCRPMFEGIYQHKADTIRSYACYVLSSCGSLNIFEKLKIADTLISDHHFGVREVIWMALRPEIEENLDTVLPKLIELAKSDDENKRRFATEVIRPRGVWCKHIEILKEKPEIAKSLLDVLMDDSSKYVQDSISNWLNDASKTRPDFVIEYCDQWLQKSNTKATQRIVKRARRTIDK